MQQITVVVCPKQWKPKMALGSIRIHIS